VLGFFSLQNISTGLGSFSKERLDIPRLICGYPFVTNSHCNLSGISTKARREDHLCITCWKCPQGEQDSRHHRGKGAGGAGCPLLGQNPAPAASLGFNLIFHTKSPTASSLHFPPHELLVPICPLHCHFTVGSEVVTRRNPMHTNMNSGYVRLLCSQSRQAKAFTQHFGACRCTWA